MCYKHTTTKAFRNCICAIGCKRYDDSCKNCDDFLNCHSFGSQDRKKEVVTQYKGNNECWPWDDWIVHVKLLLFFLKEDHSIRSGREGKQFMPW
jgi:hypothetical protein